MASADWPPYTEFQEHKNIAPSIYTLIDLRRTGPKSLHNSAFCVLPFFGWEIPQSTPCCLLPLGTDVESVKTDMLAGQRPRACQACWQIEDHGGKSDRQLKNETLDYYLNTDLAELFDISQQGNNYRASYKIDSSNICNSTCVTCNSVASSAWKDLESRHGQTKEKNWRLKLESFADQIDFVRAKSIGFRGGEPLLSSTNFEILERLIDQGRTDCFINFTTNGSIELTNKQKSILEHFDNVNMCISIDGISRVFEYLRYPLKWQHLLHNIEYFRNNGMMLSVSYTISNLNIFYHDQTLEWFKQHDLRYQVNPVKYPNCFRPGALPERVKQHLIQRIQDPTILYLLQSHDLNDEGDFLAFQKEIAKQDQWKGICMQDYLPEFAKLLG